jgi:hypothetical protein
MTKGGDCRRHIPDDLWICFVWARLTWMKSLAQEKPNAAAGMLVIVTSVEI